MLFLLPPIPGPVAIQLTFEEEGGYIIQGDQKLTLAEISAFLHEFTMMYDCIALSALPDYQQFKFSPFFWYRSGRRLQPDHQLYLNKLKHESPLSLEVIITTAASAMGIPWLVIQAIEKFRFWKLNKQELALRVEKLKLEVQQMQNQQLEKELQLDELLEHRESLKTFQRILQRMEERPLRAVDVQIHLLNDTTPRDEHPR